MTLHDDGTLDDREQVLLYLWGRFCQEWHAASFLSTGVGLADEFSRWLAKHWASEDWELQIRRDVSISTQNRDRGLFSWERELLESWAQFSIEDWSLDFATPGPNTASGFATWLANREPETRTRVEQLDLSVRAFNLLRSRDMRFVDQIDLARLDDPPGRKVKGEIADKLRRWRGDDGAAGVPARL